MAELQFPNIAGQFQQGYQQGQAQRASRLLGQAVAAPSDQRSALLGQAAQVDPIGTLQVENALSTQDASAEDRRNKAMVSMARLLTSAPEPYRDGIYQQIRPTLAKLGIQNAPAAYTPEVGQLAQNIVSAWMGPKDTPADLQTFNAMTQGLSPEDRQRAQRINLGLDAKAQGPQAVSPGSYVVDRATGQVIFQAPASLQYQNVPMGSGTAAGIFDPTTGQLRPAAGGTGATDAMQPLLAEANRRVQAGQDPDQVEQWLRGAAQSVGLQPQSATFGVGTGGRAGQYRPLSDAEVAAYGLPKGTVAQIDSNGKIDIVNKPGAQDARMQLQARQARMGLSGTLSQLDRLKEAAQALKGDHGLGGITGIEGRIPNMPGGDAARAQALLDTLRSQVGFGVLQNMREMSKTGGALGSISDREEQLLQNNLAALDPRQSKEDFQNALDKVIQYADDSKARLQGGFNDAYGDVAAASGGAAPAPAPPSSGTTLQPGHIEDGYRFKGGDPGNAANWEKQ